MTLSDAELVLAAIAVLAELAHALRVPYPVVPVLGGLALGLTPGVPAPTLDREIFFFLFLPPLLYSEAFLYSTAELKSAASEVFTLAVGLVVATTLGVAVVAHAVAGLPSPAAFVPWRRRRSDRSRLCHLGRASAWHLRPDRDDPRGRVAGQ